MNWRTTLPRVGSLMTVAQMTRSVVVCGRAFIVVTLFSGCVGHNAADDTKNRLEERAQLQTLEPRYVAHYEVSLIEVRRPMSAQARFGDIKIAPDPAKAFLWLKTTSCASYGLVLTTSWDSTC
jgi:hypothetical protein